MKAKALHTLSTICLIGGYASIIGSVALYADGRMGRHRAGRHDGIFMGLWVPTFFILSDRYKLMAEVEEDRRDRFFMSDEAQNTVEGRDTRNKHMPAGWAQNVEDATAVHVPTQSPRPLQHTRKS